MLILTILAFGLLLAIAHFVGRNYLFPAELFAATWLLSLIGLLVSGDTFFEIPAEAYLVYVVGGTAFTFGGIITLWLTLPMRLVPKETRWSGSRATRWALDVFVIALVIGLPFYWRAMSGSVDNVETALLLQSIRAAQVERSDQASSFSVVLNLPVLAQFTAMAMYFESNGGTWRRVRAAAAVILALIYGAMGGAKGNAVVLLLSVAFISSIRARRLKSSVFSVALGMALFFFSSGLLLVNFAYQSFGETSELFHSIAATVQLYWLGGLVAFGPIAVNPNVIVSTQSIDRFFLDTMRSLGLNANVPPRHADFTQVGRNMDTNVYTIYFSYFKDHGWAGTALIMFCLGVLLTLLYKGAMSGKPAAMLLFAQMEVGVVLSVVAEFFFNGLNGLIKCLLFVLVLYGVLPILDSRLKSSLLSDSVSGRS